MESNENKTGFSNRDIKKAKILAVVISGLLVAYYLSNTYLNVLQIKKIKNIK